MENLKKFVCPNCKKMCMVDMSKLSTNIYYYLDDNDRLKDFEFPVVYCPYCGLKTDADEKRRR